MRKKYVVCEHQNFKEFTHVVLFCGSCDYFLIRITVVGIVICAHKIDMTDKRENPYNPPVGAVKHTKLASPVPVTPIRNDGSWLYNSLTHFDLRKMSEEDKTYLYFAWRRLQYMENTQGPEAPVLEPRHLWGMDMKMLRLLFVEWNDLKLHHSL